MADATLQVNDAVHVERGDSQQLEGVVAYLGPVQFAEGDDWVGVRLTGTSVGLGKNDGTVKGVSYFSCGPNGGVFVRKSHISKRALTRLEELRLKRELAKQQGGGGAATSPSRGTAAAAPRTTRTPGSASAARTPPRTTSATTSSSSTTSSPSKNKTRLEEIRERRAALAGKHGGASTSVSPSSSKTTSPATSPEKTAANKEQLERLQTQVEEMGKQVQELTDKLKNKEEENASLQQSLSKAEQDLHDANKAAEQARQQREPAMQVSSTTADNEDHELQLQKAQDDNRDATEQLQDALAELETSRRELDRERQERASDVEQLTLVRSELSLLQNEFQTMSDQAATRGASDASHYKERAKLQAELGAAKRLSESLEKEKLELESVLEDVTLDKDQLQEEKEALHDRLEELKIDAETAQMEVEELRGELEIAKEASEGQPPVSGGGAGDADDDVAQALSIQNSRLREALIRLREQASVEKMELTRELRAVEKAAAAAAALTEEVESLRGGKGKMEEEICDLKEMVDQGSAFESMVESLSDRVLLLEDDNLALQATIREMEEAADITAEMEEVQADENKTLMRDLEGRDAIIRNLEEAIKMQRRREEDFQRTVGNYRKTVETLKEEKKALMAFQEGEEGEKGDLLETSRKALARAAQLVVDAAVARKREAEAVFDHIEADVQRHLAERLESLLPESVSSSEVASVKGEMLLSRVTGKASRSLEGMGSVFAQMIQSGMSKVTSEDDELEPVDQDASFSITDEAAQCITNVLHQSEMAGSTIDVASDLLKLLSVGQWPDLLSPEASTELGAVVGNSITELDVALGDQLRILKEEGVLSPHTSNIGAFQQTVQNTMQSLKTTLEADGNVTFPNDWTPPGWQMLKDVSSSKFSCMSSAAVVASIVSPDDGTHTSTTSSPVSDQAVAVLMPLMTKLDQIVAEASRSCHRLVRLDLQRESTISELSDLATAWKESSFALSGLIKETFTDKSEFTQEEVTKCTACADATMRLVSQFSSALRASNLNAETEGRFHPLSPESKDAWDGVSSLARAIRSVDGDADDINYLLRARALENRLAEAMEDGPKLSLANTKVSSLEKSLSSRSKEIAMQNARVSELEKVLAKTNTLPSSVAIKSPEKSSSQEVSTLKEENRVLTEAMDVLHRQVDEYENEIRLLKDFKSPNKGAQRGSRVSRASPFLSPGLSTGKSKPGDELQDASPSAIDALEAAIFRPALQAAQRDASKCKAQSMAAVMSSLPSLPVASTFSSTNAGSEESKEAEPPASPTSLLAELTHARSRVRHEKASFSVIDLSKSDKSSRLALMESMAESYHAEMILADAVAAAEQWRVADSSGSVVSDAHLVGRVKIAGEGSSVVPVNVTNVALQQLQMQMIH